MLGERACNLLLKILLAFILTVFISGDPKVAWSAQIHPENIVLTWTGDTRTTQAITWQSTGTALNQLQYMEAGVQKDFRPRVKTVIAKEEPLPVADFGKVIYSVEISDLKPGTRYFYRIGNGKDWGDAHVFQTAGKHIKQFKFLVFGDSQSELYNTWHTTIQQAYRLHHDAVFFTNVGDLINVGSEEKEWAEWLAAVNGIADTLPAMPLTGNHEMYTPQWKVNTAPALFLAHFQLPRNGPDGLQEQVYSFDYGNVHFAMLDSQEREEGQFVPNMLAKQREWLEKDLARSDKLWKVIFIHRPPYHIKSAKSNDNIRQAFGPVMDKYNVDLVFAGHEHVYARTYPLYADKITDGKVSGTVYITTGRSGEKVYEKAAANIWDEVFYNPVDQANYLSVEVRGEVLSVKAWKQNGELIDDWTRSKYREKKMSYFLESIN